MSLTFEQLEQAEYSAFARLLNIQFAQGKLFDIASPAPNEQPAELAEQKQLAAAWLYQQQAALQPWNKASFNHLLNHLAAFLKKRSQTISPWLIAELRFSFLLLDALNKTSELDESLNTVIFRLKPMLLAYSIQEDGFWFGGHASKKYFDMVYKAAIGFQSGLGKQADTSIELISASIDSACQHEFNSTSALFELMQNFKQNLKTANTRLNRLLERLVETETGILKSNAANLASAQFIQRLCQSHPLPEHWLSFLVKSLRPELNAHIVEFGKRSESLLALEQGLSPFLNFYASGASLDLAQAMSLNVSLEEQLKEAFPAISEDTAELFAKTAADFLSLEQGQSPTGAKPLSEYEAADSLFLSKSVSSNLVGQVVEFQALQWFSYQSEAGQAVQRIQLLLKLDEIGQFLFVNANGQKVLSCDIDSLATLLASQQLKVIGEGAYLKQSIALVCGKLIESSIRQEQALIQAKNDELAKQALLAEKKAQLKAQKQRQLEAEKAREEAITLEAEMEAAKSVTELSDKTDEIVSDTLNQQADGQRFNREGEDLLAEAVEQETEIPYDVLRKLRLAIDGLLIGSWIEVQDADGTQRRIKLAVKFAATNRFVFVDPEGVTDCELQRDELIDHVVSGKMTILETDQYFADRLNKLLAQVNGE